MFPILSRDKNERSTVTVYTSFLYVADSEDPPRKIVFE